MAGAPSSTLVPTKPRRRMETPRHLHRSWIWCLAGALRPRQDPVALRCCLPVAAASLENQAMASSASDQGAGRRIRPLSVFTSGSGQSSHAPPPRTRSRPPQPCLFPPLLRTGGARLSPLTAPFLRLRGPQPRLRPSATQRGPARPSPLRSGPQPRVSSPRSCALLGPARFGPVPIFFSDLRFSHLS